MSLKVVKVKRNYEKRQDIGESVVDALQALPRTSVTLLAIIPRMLSFFATSPERYEVTEVDILIEDGE